MLIFNDFNSKANFGTFYFLKITPSILGLMNLNPDPFYKTKQPP